MKRWTSVYIFYIITKKVNNTFFYNLYRKEKGNKIQMLVSRRTEIMMFFLMINEDERKIVTFLEM